MSQNQNQQPNEDPDSYPSPTGEEIVAGALAEMMEDAGVNPLGRASSPSENSTPEKVIPPWFQKLSWDI